MTDTLDAAKLAKTQAPLLDVIAQRWSPRSFDSSYRLTEQELTSILAAARWAPSAQNIQPWRFSVFQPGDEAWEAVTQNGLTGWNRAWAPSASGKPCR